MAKSPHAGLSPQPKGKSLFVNTARARAVMLAALRWALEPQGEPVALTPEERVEAERLVLRLEARL